MPDKMSRRSFLLGSLGMMGGIALSPAMQAQSQVNPADAFPQPVSPDAWRKHGIILEPTESWEGSDIQNFTSPAEPLPDGAWRIWYSVSDAGKGYGLAYAEGIPGKTMRKVPAQCSPNEPADAPFSIGNLPEKWKPVQGTHILLPTGRHRLYFWAHGPEILRYLAAESNDGRRYRVLDLLRPVLYHPSDRAARGAMLPDEQPAKPGEISNDATTIYQLPDGTFEMYSVALVKVSKEDPAYIAHDNAPGLLRVIDRYTSGDGLRFETRERIIERDAADPVDQQFYYLSVTRTAKGCVGMLGHYRCEAQTMDLEWCFSSDGVKWLRPLRRPWLERGKPPAPDCYGIYAPNQIMYHDGQWHLFYMGWNATHNGKLSSGKPRQVIMYATVDSIWS
jgi:hypothetical protein